MSYAPAKHIAADHPGSGIRFCRQCGRYKRWPAAFIGLKGVPIATCTECAIRKAEYARVWRGWRRR